MEVEGLNLVENGDAPESDQASVEQTEQSGQEDGLLSQDQQELSARVAHLEKRCREQEDEIVCLKSALADVTRRLTLLETTKSTNSILPSRPFTKPSRRTMGGVERPKSQVIESTNFSTARSSVLSTPRHPPRGASASTMKKWGSTEDTNSGKTPRPHSSALSNSNIKEPTWNSEDKYVRMHLKGRPVQLYAPSNIEDEGKYDVKAPQPPPPETLKLEWVYGYRGRDCRSNLYTLATGEAVYFNAAVVVLHNFDEQTQRHYLEHTDDIKCIAIHPTGMKIATGQVAGHEKKEGKMVASAEKKPHVRIWEPVNLTTLHVLGEGDFQRGVCCVAFSKVDNGKMLLAVDESNDHVLSVWDVSHEKKVSKITESKASGDPVTQCDFHPTEENSIVCCGKSQITFWGLEGKKLDKKTGIFQKHDKGKIIICFCFANNGDVLSGDSNGNIYVWEKGQTKISKGMPGEHEGGVFSLCTTKDGTILSGGKDGRIVEWDAEYQKTGYETKLPEASGPVRMISQGPGNMMLVGTIRNCILQGNKEMEYTVVVEGHKEELWGLDASPSQHQFLTCGYDKHLYYWDAQSHSVVWKKEIADPAHCCAIHPSLDIAAVGLQTGKWIVVDLQSHDVVGVYNDGKEQQECIAFSPDGKKLAVGNRDNYIYVYEVSDDGRKYHKIGRCSGHSSFVTHIDWSEDGEIIRSNSGDYEVLYWRSSNCKQETSKDDVRDKEWATTNCTLAFQAIGVWPDEADGTDVNNCAVSHNRKLLVSADDFGKVNLLEFPSIHPAATGHSYPGHSSHVTMAKFLCDDSRVISTGGRDMAVMQWIVS